MKTLETPILISAEQVMELLSLTEEQVNWLSDTDQLQPIHICGQIRFDAHDVHRLTDSYKTTQARRKH